MARARFRLWRPPSQRSRNSCHSRRSRRSLPLEILWAAAALALAAGAAWARAPEQNADRRGIARAAALVRRAESAESSGQRRELLRQAQRGVAAAASERTRAGRRWLERRLERLGNDRPSRSQVRQVRRALESLEAAMSAKAPSPTPGARATLGRVLARPEFRRGAYETWRDRVNHWLYEQLEKILGWLPELGLPTPGKWLSYLLLAAVIGVAAVVFARIAARHLAGREGKTGMQEAASRVARVIEWEEWLAAARKGAREGRWAEAARAAYMAGLMFLDSRGLIEYRPWRTNGEYLRALREGRAAQHEPLARMTEMLEPVLYGRAEAGEAQYEQAMSLCALVRQEAA